MPPALSSIIARTASRARPSSASARRARPCAHGSSASALRPPHELVPERIRLAAVVRDDLAPPLPPRRIGGVGHLVLEDLRDEVELERRADDRGVAKEHAVLRLERVDASGAQ